MAEKKQQQQSNLLNEHRVNPRSEELTGHPDKKNTRVDSEEIGYTNAEEVGYANAEEIRYTNADNLYE